MRHTAFEKAVELLRNREVLVSYSGGKDSMIVMDIAVRVASKVDAFFMELVPGLDFIERQLEWAESRWGIAVRRYPHWLRAAYLRDGVYCFHAADYPQLDINDVYALARRDAGIDYIVTGAKRADSLWRRRTGAMKFAQDNLKAPLWDWSSRDIFAYLKARNLPRPDNDGRLASGIDLTDECITWLYEKHRSTYDQYERHFPFIGAVIRRREWFPEESAAPG